MENLNNKLFNLDFEKSLRDARYRRPSWCPLNGELEHLFFWVSTDTESLYTQKSYEKSYLDYVSSLKEEEVHYSNNKEGAEPWWGDVSSERAWNKEKKLNSKVELSRNRKELGLEAFPSFVCENEEQFSKAKEELKENFVIKEEFQFSGKGLHFNSVPNKVNYPFIVEPWVKRVRDFSLFINDEKFYVLQSQVSPRGNYKGGHIKKGFTESSLLKKGADKIWSFYKEKYQCDFLQIDSFQFLNGHELEINILGEINHRRTLGRIYHQIHERFAGEYSFVGLVPSNLLKHQGNFIEIINNFNKFQFNPVTKTGVIALSPGKERFSLFYFSESSERTLQFLIRDWWKVSVKEGQKLPPEFIIYL